MMFPIVIKFQCSPHSLSISVVEHVGCIGYAQLAVINAKHLNNYIFVDFFSSPVSLYSIVLRVLRPSSIVQRPSFGVICAEHNSHSIEDNKPLLYTYICYVYRLCAKKYCGAIYNT